jgi:hypothetical protein
MPFGFIAPKTLNYLAFQSLDLSVPAEGFSRSVSGTLNLSVPAEGFSRSVSGIQKCVRHTKFDIYIFNTLDGFFSE